MNQRTKAPVVKLAPNLNKIVEAILVVLKTGKMHGKVITQYDIVKTLFLADRRFLNEFGRPITFDNYFAMKHGPVPTHAYDLLKGNAASIGGELPWTCSPIPGSRAMSFEPLVDPDLDELAPSEIEILSDSLVTIKSLGFNQVRKLTHEDPAYIDAWEDDDNGNGSYPMSLAMLLDVPDMQIARDLEFVSRNDII